MSEQAQQLIAQLRNFRTRKAALDGLLILGDEAVPDLIHALAHPMENVRWCARSVLAQLGSDTAVQQLIDTLDDPQRQGEAAAALREVTGQSIGVDRQAWVEWNASGGQAPPPPAPEPAAEAAPPQAATGEPAPEAAPTEMQAEAPPEPKEPPRPMSDGEVVQAAVEGTGIDVRQHSGGYVLTVPLERNRRQRVTISFSAHDFEDEPLVVVYTECGPAEPRNYEWALRQNLRMSFGAIALRDRGGQPTFVMVNTHIRSTLDVEELRKSVLLLARKGDKLEEALTKADER